jgi:hypothetical protein
MPEQRGYFNMKMKGADQLKHDVQIAIINANVARVVHWAPLTEHAKRLSDTHVILNEGLLAKNDATVIATTVLRHLNSTAPILLPEREPVLSIRERNATERTRERPSKPVVPFNPAPTMPQLSTNDVAQLMREFLECQDRMRTIQAKLIPALGGVLPGFDPEPRAVVAKEQPAKRAKPINRKKAVYRCKECGTPKSGPRASCASCDKTLSPRQGPDLSYGEDHEDYEPEPQEVF